uniref:Selenoprotein F n=1 Tax=Strongylocentrotus purpuratus TaxID=7668 RepID=A0A7M7HKT8_STRPU
MVDLWYLLALFLVLIVQVARSAGSLEKLSSELCLTQGFSSNLLCSACGNLGEFKLNELEGTCRQCCQDDAEEDNFTPFHHAHLEVCGCKLGRFPQIQAFVKGDRPKKYPNLKIKYLRGADPVLKFLDEKNKVIETLSIEKWNTDSVDEFLMERLKPSH